MAIEQKRIKVGLIGAPSGIKGEVRVKSYTEPSHNLFGYAPLYDEEGHKFIIERFRVQKDHFIVQFASIDNRDLAQALTHKILYADRDKFSKADEEEYYHVDLIGLSVFEDERFDSNQDGNFLLGRVSYVENFGAGDLLEIQFKDFGKILLPFTQIMVPRLSISGGYLTLSKMALDLVQARDGNKDV